MRVKTNTHVVACVQHCRLACVAQPPGALELAGLDDVEHDGEQDQRQHDQGVGELLDQQQGQRHELHEVDANHDLVEHLLVQGEGRGQGGGRQQGRNASWSVCCDKCRCRWWETASARAGKGVNFSMKAPTRPEPHSRFPTCARPRRRAA